MKKLLSVLLCCVAFYGCEEETTAPATSTLTTSFTNLPDPGENSQYEGWIIVNNEPKSTGTFTVNSSGTPSKTSFTVNSSDLAAASAFVLTVEPKNDTDPKPSAIKYLAGDFSGSMANLTFEDMKALGRDLSPVTGKFLLATPTTQTKDDEKSGVWFIDNSSGAMVQGLMNLPALPAGWVYEGWAVINGNPLTTGRFSVANMKDSAMPYSGPLMGPEFPGEDYVANAPTGLTFPTNLTGADIVLTLEPSPDNSAKPSGIKILSGTAADVMGSQMMTNTRSMLPTGKVTR